PIRYSPGNSSWIISGVMNISAIPEPWTYISNVSGKKSKTTLPGPSAPCGVSVTNSRLNPDEKRALPQIYHCLSDPWLLKLFRDILSWFHADSAGTDRTDRQCALPGSRQYRFLPGGSLRSEEHTSELQSRFDLV